MADYKIGPSTVVGWATTFSPSVASPVINNRIFKTKQDALDYVNNNGGTACIGLILSVVNDGVNNGIYQIQFNAGHEGDLLDGSEADKARREGRYKLERMDASAAKSYTAGDGIRMSGDKIQEISVNLNNTKKGPENVEDIDVKSGLELVTVKGENKKLLQVAVADKGGISIDENKGLQVDVDGTTIKKNEQGQLVAQFDASDIKGGAGITSDAQGKLTADIDTTAGLKFTDSTDNAKIAVDFTNVATNLKGTALGVDGGTLNVKVDGTTITNTTNDQLSVNTTKVVADGLKVDGGIVKSENTIKVAQGDGITVGTGADGKVSAKGNEDAGITVTASGIEVKRATNGAIGVQGDGIKVERGAGIDKDADSITVGKGNGIDILDNGIQANINTATGLEFTGDAEGSKAIAIKLDAKAAGKDNVDKNILTQSSEGLYANVHLVEVTPQDENKKRVYALQDSSNAQLGVAIDVDLDNSLIDVKLVSKTDDEYTSANPKPQGNGPWMYFHYETAAGDDKKVFVSVADFLQESEFKNGLHVNADGTVEAKLGDGLEFGPADGTDNNRQPIQIKRQTDSGLQLTTDGLAVGVNGQNGLEKKTDTLVVKLAPGITYAELGDNGATDEQVGGLTVAFSTEHPHSGLQGDPSGIAVKSSKSGGLELQQEGLENADGGIGIKLHTYVNKDRREIEDSGLSTDADGLKINTAEKGSLSINTTTNTLEVKTTRGITKDTTTGAVALNLNGADGTGSESETEYSKAESNISGLRITKEGSGNGTEYVSVKANNNKGIQVTKDGVEVMLASNGGLTVDQNGIKVDVTATDAITDAGAGLTKPAGTKTLAVKSNTNVKAKHQITDPETGETAGKKDSIDVTADGIATAAEIAPLALKQPVSNDGNVISVTENMGSYKPGDKIIWNESILEVLKKMLSKTYPCEIKKPSLIVTFDTPSKQIEKGSSVGPVQAKYSFTDGNYHGTDKWKGTALTQGWALGIGATGSANYNGQALTGEYTQIEAAKAINTKTTYTVNWTIAPGSNIPLNSSSEQDPDMKYAGDSGTSSVTYTPETLYQQGYVAYGEDKNTPYKDTDIVDLFKTQLDKAPSNSKWYKSGTKLQDFTSTEHENIDQNTFVVAVPTGKVIAWSEDSLGNQNIPSWKKIGTITGRPSGDYDVWASKFGNYIDKTIFKNVYIADTVYTEKPY